ncbi:MAG: chemotaxis protein CheW [Deltaproteobacteria bacterium]|nr:chemotaxis protein CheW [Deltaproteobacteria bacterium]
MTETREDPLHSLFARLDEARAERVTESAGEATRAFLCFWLAGEEYGVDIREIREISKMRVVTPVPRVSRDVMGVMALRGAMIAVVDLRLRLGLESPDEPLGSRRILVVKRNAELIGLLVDEVTDVIRLTAAAIEPPPPMTPPRGAAVGRAVIESVAGVGRIDERTLILLDLDAVMELEAKGDS